MRLLSAEASSIRLSRKPSASRINPIRAKNYTRIRCIFSVLAIQKRRLSADPAFDDHRFSDKVEASWDVLYRHYASRMSAAQFDHLFARFVFGLTSPSRADGEPSVHFESCWALVLLKITPERAHAALYTVPELTEPWVEDVYQLVEEQGAKIGLALVERKPSKSKESAVVAGENMPNGAELEEQLP